MEKQNRSNIFIKLLLGLLGLSGFVFVYAFISGYFDLPGWARFSYTFSIFIIMYVELRKLRGKDKMFLYSTLLFMNIFVWIQSYYLKDIPILVSLIVVVINVFSFLGVILMFGSAELKELFSPKSKQDSTLEKTKS